MILHTKIQGYILNWTTVASFGEGLANYIQNAAGISRNCDLVTATGMENCVSTANGHMLSIHIPGCIDCFF